VTSLYYLAYGSNLHPFRLKERIPSASFIGTVVMAGRQVIFHKRSDDGSGKCNLIENPEKTAHAVLYEISSSEEHALDKVEGLGKGYYKKQFKVPVGDVEYQAFGYIAASTHIDTALAPFDWYKEMVTLGATYHQFPDSYIQEIGSVGCIADRNTSRAEEKKALIANMQRYNSAHSR
jgi:gamma-glutamylcyclotransferase